MRCEHLADSRAPRSGHKLPDQLAGKVYDELPRDGVWTGPPVARCTVERPMRADDMCGGVGGSRRIARSDAATRRPADLVGRQFHAAPPNELCVVDFPCVAAWSGSATSRSPSMCYSGAVLSDPKINTPAPSAPSDCFRKEPPKRITNRNWHGSLSCTNPRLLLNAVAK